QMAWRAAADVEHLRRVDEVGVAIARRQRHEHELSGRNRYSGDLDVGGGDARNRTVHYTQTAQQLLDGGPDRVRIVADRDQLVAMSQQCERAKAEHVRRGFVT